MRPAKRKAFVKSSIKDIDYLNTTNHRILKMKRKVEEKKEIAEV